MHCTRDYDPDDEDELPDGVYYDDEPATVPCPYCRRPVVEDAERCPYCENYISSEDAPPGQRSNFVVVVMIFALLAAAAWALGR